MKIAQLYMNSKRLQTNKKTVFQNFRAEFLDRWIYFHKSGLSRLDRNIDDVRERRDIDMSQRDELLASKHNRKREKIS